MKKTITVIDTSGFLFRSYFALPPLKSDTGFPTGLLTGFINFVSNIGKDFKTDYLVFVLDAKGDTFRNKIYSEYKAQRPDVPEDLIAQLPIAISWITKMGFKTAIKTGYEADDLIASIATDAVKKGLEVRIVSHDKDLYQLIDDDNKIYLFDPIKKNIIDQKKCLEKFGVHPKQFTNYQSLIGDSADNIPGVRGVGPKTAQALINEYDNLDNIYNNLENIEKKRWKTLLTDGKDMAYISKKLVTLVRDSHTIEDIKQFELPQENPILKIADILMEYGMSRALKKVDKNGLAYKTTIPEKNNNANVEYILLNSEEKLSLAVNMIPSNSIIAFDTETTDVDVKNAKIVGFSFAYLENKAYYVPINHISLDSQKQISMEFAREIIKQLSAYKIVMQNFKFDYEIIKNNFDYEMKIHADTMILSWLLNSSQKVGLDYQVDKYFKHTMIPFKEVVKKGENFSQVSLEEATKYAAEDALYTLKLYNKQVQVFKETKQEELLKIAFNVEFDFIYVLANMEENGIKLNVDLMEKYKKENGELLDNLTKDIYLLSGEQFNINSPKQLGEILFEKLNLPIIKKTKTGYSTNEEVLNSLIDKHEIISLILKYREAKKLQTTYIEPLLQFASKNIENKIFTSFLQTGTTTGRLSSKNPNLQNIPVGYDSKIQIREAFVPSKGYKLVGIDYSQIELRLLAHFSEDKALVDAFNNNLDIHYQTAVKIFGEEQAKEKRPVAKSINFGLIYGMGSRRLAETLGITTKEAKEYIESYFKAFESVKGYLKSVEEYAQEHSYVKTIIGRKRFFDFENARPMFKAAYLREAVNTLFQGSAADLIKLSMLKIFEKYKNSDEVKILLQIHDELIVEVEEEKIEEITLELVKIMENILNLKVPLKVTSRVGSSWQKLK